MHNGFEVELSSRTACPSLGCRMSGQRPANFAHQIAWTQLEMEPECSLGKADLVLERICCLCRNVHAAAKEHSLPCMLSHCTSSYKGCSPGKLPHAIEVQPCSPL